jgi:hypothetical protein
MPAEFRKATALFSLFLLTSCLIAAIFVGPSALVAWVLATSGLVAFGHTVERKRPTDNSKTPTKRKSH